MQPEQSLNSQTREPSTNAPEVDSKSLAWYRCNQLTANESTQEGATQMSDRIDSAVGVPGVRVPPRWVFSFFNPIAQLLLGAGVPMGFNGLITIRGRKSGLPRTTPVAIIEVSGRRWVWAPWGDARAASTGVVQPATSSLRCVVDIKRLPSPIRELAATESFAEVHIGDQLNNWRRPT